VICLSFSRFSGAGGRTVSLILFVAFIIPPTYTNNINLINQFVKSFLSVVLPIFTSFMPVSQQFQNDEHRTVCIHYMLHQDNACQMVRIRV